MTEQIAEQVRRLAIGRKIRTLRERKGMGVAAVAEKTRMPEVLLSRIERDEVAPTVANLINIASALDTSVDVFFQEDSFQQKVEVVRRGEGRSIRRVNEGTGALTYRYQSLAYRLPGKRMEPFLVEFEVGLDEAPNPVTHEGEEFLHILDGEVECMLDGERVVLGPGDSIYFHSSTPHSLRALGTVQPRALAVLYPFAR